MTDMHDDMTTRITSRGQTSVPSRLRRDAGLRVGTRLHWYPVSDREFRVAVETTEESPGPLAALGWAARFHRNGMPTTDEAMSELRAGE